MTWEEEATAIADVAGTHGIDACFIAAIRKAQNGDSGSDFGIVSIIAEDYPAQLRVCVATVRDYLTAYGPNPLATITVVDGVRRICYSEAFVQYCARRYPPVGADPGAWCTVVERFYMGFLNHGLVRDPETATAAHVA